MRDIWAFLLQTLNATVIALLLLLLKTMLADKLSPRWQYGIWSVLAAALLLPANLLGRHSLLNVALWVEAGKTAVERGLSSAFSGPYTATSISLPLPLWPGVAPRSVTDWLFCLYAAGVLLLLARYLLAYLRLRHLLNRVPPGGAAQVERVAQAYGLKGCRSVAVEGLSSAFVCGVFRPILALPAGVATDDKVVLHELLHRKHGDVFLGWVACLFRCLHWCNPLLWYVFHRVGNDCESLCDQRVLERLEGEERREYGGILLSMANEKYARTPGTSSAANGGRNIALRIAAIARFKRYPAGMGLVSLCIGIVLLSACLPTSLAARPTFTPAGRPWGLALSMASARTTRCTTPAGALDTYAKGLLTENGIYLAMASPLSAHPALAAAMEGHEGMSYYHLPFEPIHQFPVPYYVYNLFPDGAGGYTALLVFPQSAQDRAGTLVTVPVSVTQEEGAWVVRGEETQVLRSNAYTYGEDFLHFSGRGDRSLPSAVAYTGALAGFDITITYQTVHQVDNQIRKGSGFFSTTAFDMEAKPHGEFIHAFQGYDFFATYTGDPTALNRLRWVAVPLDETGEHPELQWGMGSFSSSDGTFGGTLSGEDFLDWDGTITSGAGSGYGGGLEGKEITHPAGYLVELVVNGEAQRVTLRPQTGGGS